MIRLKFERVNRQISQERLAFVAQVPQPVISLIEAGTWNPTVDQLNALAGALHVTPSSALLQEVVIPTVSRPLTVEARIAARREVAR